MAFPNGTEQQTDSSTGEERINSLLTGGGGTAVADEPERVAEDTSVADADFAPEAEETDGVETDGGESTEEADSSEEADSGETEFELTEQDSDFSDNAYERAAAHYTKQFGKTLDPNDKADRAILRELIQRGQRIKALQSEEETPKDEDADTAGKTEEVKPAVAAKPTEEQIMAQLANAEAYAKANVVPKVAMKFASRLINAMWPGKNAGDKITQEQATELAEVFQTFGAMVVADAIPAILGAVPTAVQSDPMFGRMREMAVRETAIDEVLSTTNKAGEAAYPDFEKMVDSGTIKQMMATDELKNAVFHKDPQKNLVAKLKFAYRLAKGQRVDVGALEKAAARGRDAEKERATRVGAGRTPPGTTRGSLSAPSTASNFMNKLVSGSGSKFSRAIAESRSK